MRTNHKLSNRVSWPMSRIEFAVLMSGVTSMGLEILAGRIIAPKYGSSIYTWGSIIGIFLAALSLGYWIGGKRAAKRATHGKIAWVFGASAAYIAFIVFFQDLILNIGLTVSIPPQYSPLIPVTILFGPPTYVLGFISPYAAELSQKEGTGKASGHVYALGTIGSIVGTFWTTFHLVPSFEINTIALIFGVLLIGSAVIVAYESASWASWGGTIVVIALLVTSVAVAPSTAAVPGEVIHQEESAYQQITVAQQGDVRTLYSDGQPHSAIDLENPNRHVFSYTRYFHMPWLMEEDIDRVLIIGGGGFTGSRHITSRTNATVDVVEIDPAMIRVSRNYFNLSENDQLNVINAPGRQYLQETNRTYDLIIMDAYKKDDVPFQLTTAEFFELSSDHLSEDGIMYVNMIASEQGAASQIYRAEYRTMQQVYPQVYSFPVGQEEGVGNIELIATKSSERITEAELRRRNARRDIGINLSQEIDTYTVNVDANGAPVLRDDRAPVDALMSPMAGQNYAAERYNATG